MGCNNSKQAALQELAHITTQIKNENIQLEKERDLLKSHHDDRPEEEKDSLQDLRLMHNDLEKEIKELKEIMLEFLPVPETKDSDFLGVKNLIERITNAQIEIEEKTELLKEKEIKKKGLASEMAGVDKNIHVVENQIMELEATVQRHEWNLKDQGFEETNKKEMERQRSLVEEIRNHHINFAEIREVSKESGQSDDDDDDSQASSSSSDQKRTYENLLALSEMEINKELKEVQTELDVLTHEIGELELPESEIFQMNSYVYSLQNKLNSISKNSNFGEQILESQARIQELKQEKKKLKLELQSSVKRSEKDDNLYAKLQTLDNILNFKPKPFEVNINTSELVADVEDTLKKARQVSMELKKKCYCKHD